MISSALKLLAVSVGVCLLCVSGARAQGTADIVGTITDTSGAVLLGANVTLTNIGTNISRSTTTSTTGDYTFPQMPVGTYSITVEAMGFKRFASNVSVSAGDRARVDAKMELGEVSQTVEVQSSSTPALQTDSSTLGSLVTQQAVEDVPLNGRNFVKLVQLSVGVSEGAPNATSSGTRPDDRRQTSAFSANGQSESLNNQMIDGMDNNERVIGTIGVRPSVDAIQEVNVSTNMYSAEYGRTGGGVVNLITKSGTNAFHGSAYEFFRNKVLNANPTYQFPTPTGFNPSTPLKNPPFRQNQYGASLGGPIAKDKTFFFADYEGFTAATGLSITGMTVPTLCERGTTLLTAEGYKGPTSGAGIGCPDNGNAIPAASGDFSDALAISGPGGAACPAAQYGSTCPYVNLTGNAANFDPMGLTMFSLYPLPTGPGTIGNYSSAPTKTQSSKTADLRIDQHFSDSNTFFARYSFNQVDTVTPDAFPTVWISPTTHEPVSSGTSGAVMVHPSAPGSGGTFGAINGFQGPAHERQQSWAESFVHVFRPNLLINLKANFLKSGIQSVGINTGSYVSNKLGFPCNSVQCVNVPNNLETSGLAGMNFSSAGNSSTPILTAVGDGAAIPLLQFDDTFQYSAALTWTKGAHSAKFGVVLIRRQASIDQGIAPHGEWTFTGVYTGEPTGDLLMGYSVGNGSTFTGWRSVGIVAPQLRTWEPSAYVQDDWRTTRWLTLNLGLRYDIFTPYTEKHGRIANFDPARGLFVSPSIPGSQQVGSTDGIQTDYKNIAPRFGFAATLKHNTVVRGGFGLSFFPTNYSSTFAEKNAPYYFLEPCANQTNAPGGGSTAPCPAPFFNGVLANYGSLPSGSTKNSSMVGQSGGVQLDQGLPFPTVNATSIFIPAACGIGADPTSAGCNSSSSNPYTIISGNNAIPFHFPAAYLEQFNLQVQKELGSGNVVTLGYVGELGRHIERTLNINSFSNPTQTANADPKQNVVPLAHQFPWLVRTPIAENTDIATSAYNALQATFVRRMSNGLTVNIGYAWAHALANTGGACTPSAGNPCYYDNPKNPSSPYIVPWFNRGFAWGNTGNDVADRISGSINYEVPYGKSLTGVEGAILKGWAFNAAGAWQTGIPFTVNAPGNGNVTQVSGAGAGVPDQTCSGRVGHPRLLQWFNPACFVSQTPGMFGNEHPGQLMGPPQRRLDFSMFKEFPVNERFRLQFRAEVFNLLNVANFGQPNATLSYGSCSASTTRCSGAVTFPTGSINALNLSSTPRQIQLALKLLF